MTRRLTIQTRGQGLYEFTDQVEAAVREVMGEAVAGAVAGTVAGTVGGTVGGVGEGLCTILVQHTSASLVIQENADPSARHDLEQWLSRLVPENDPHYTHTMEGPDDMPSHIKAALTSTTLSIPIIDGRLALGLWQGIYLWEHRRSGHRRHCVVHVGR